jgi:hypothetical protein
LSVIKPLSDIGFKIQDRRKQSDVPTLAIVRGSAGKRKTLSGGEALMLETKPKWMTYAEMAETLTRPQLPRNIHKSTERLVFCYQFYKVRNDWWHLSETEREEGKREFLELLSTFDQMAHHPNLLNAGLESDHRFPALAHRKRDERH